jgi:hypothetical protein
MAGPYDLFKSADRRGAYVGVGRGSFYNSSAYNPRQYGVFSANPLATPKYALNNGTPRDAEYKETLARMYISLAGTSDELKKAYLRSLPNDARVNALAQVLIGPNTTRDTASNGFIDFFLQQVNESFQEKLQVEEVLGDNYVAWYFGQAPPVFQYNGTLLNSKQDDQVTGFALAYQHLIRGSALAQRGTLLRLRYDNIIVGGSVNSMTRILNAENEMACPFAFSILVKEYIVLLEPEFAKISPEDYVQLQTAFYSDSAADAIGQVSDRRVRLTTVVPARVSIASSVGQEPPADPPDPNLPKPQQQEAAVAAETTSSPASDVQNPGDLQEAPGIDPTVKFLVIP